MRRTTSIWDDRRLLPILALFPPLLLGFGLASPARAAVIVLFGVLVVLALTLWLPPHLFLGASLAVLASSSAARFEQHPIIFGSIKLYTFDLLLVLVLARAVLPRDRRFNELRILNSTTALPLMLWALVMLVAGLRGHLAGNSLGAIARLETPLVYLPAFCWGFMRILGEASVSIPRVVRALTITSLVFIAYAGFARVTHHRFGAQSGSGIAAVQTTSGVLRRDYGFFSAFQLYALLALAGLAYLTFSRRATFGAVLVAFAGVTASVLTLVRGLIFGVAAGAIFLLVLAVKARWHVKLSLRLLPLAALCALGGTLFVIFSPAAARGVTERFLPGIVVQTQTATLTTEYRVKVLTAGKNVALNEPVGLGFVPPNDLEQAGFPAIYIPHSQWASLLVYAGWPGVFLLGWAGLAVVRRSFQLPAAAPWLHPLVVATGFLLLVQGFGWDVLFSQTWSLGMVALVLALRFGLGTSKPQLG